MTTSNAPVSPSNGNQSESRGPTDMPEWSLRNHSIRAKTGQKSSVPVFFYFPILSLCCSWLSLQDSHGIAYSVQQDPSGNALLCCMKFRSIVIFNWFYDCLGIYISAKNRDLHRFKSLVPHPYRLRLCFEILLSWCWWLLCYFLITRNTFVIKAYYLTNGDRLSM